MIVPSSPRIKMRKIDQLKYPNFTNLVKGLKNYVQNNSFMKSKLMEYSGLTEVQIMDKLTFGQGPLLKLVPNLKDSKGNACYGLFQHDNSDMLLVNENFVLGLETVTLQSSYEATYFLLAVTILHEFIHYGNFLIGLVDTYGDEYGSMWENDVYGMLITKNTAGQYILKFKDK